MDNLSISENSPGLSDVPGFTAAGAGCDIRNKGDLERLDVALVFSEQPCAAAGVFTVNAVKAAPVRQCQEVLRRGRVHGIVANSGNANACTGEGGMEDARETARMAAEDLGVGPETLFVCSTGRIGERLPMERLERGIRDVVARRAASAEEGKRAADAILTSDTRAKTITVRFDCGGNTITVSGMAKGAGMIQPNMATMLAFLATDAEVEQGQLQKVLSEAVRLTFNRITVDGDMSTNDTVLLLANGASGVRIDEQNSAALSLFREAVWKVCDFLAEKIVSDGEKITKVVEILVGGASSEEDAEKVARAIGNSLLVKSSWYGNDPNWGRLADAAGYSGAKFDDQEFDIFYGETAAVLAGEPVHTNRAKWKEVVQANRFTITIRLNVPGGEGKFRLLATDLTESYVRFNKSE
jgi:glutamate N-acetyltransferase / amino-acid N-acetyltransferase